MFVDSMYFFCFDHGRDYVPCTCLDWWLNLNVERLTDYIFMSDWLKVCLSYDHCPNGGNVSKVQICTLLSYHYSFQLCDANAECALVPV